MLARYWSHFLACPEESGSLKLISMKRGWCSLTTAFTRSRVTRSSRYPEPAPSLPQSEEQTWRWFHPDAVLSLRICSLSLLVTSHTALGSAPAAISRWVMLGLRGSSCPLLLISWWNPVVSAL